MSFHFLHFPFCIRKILRIALVLLFLLAVGLGKTTAQTLAQRFFLSYETSLNTSEGYGPAAISLAAEPKIWLINHFYMGLKCDVGVGAFGDNKYNFQNLSREPLMGSLTSLMLNGYFEERFGYADCFVGFGLGRYLNNKYFGASNSASVHFDTLQIDPGWGRSFSFGAKSDHGYMSFTFKKSFKKYDYANAPPVMSATVGVEFGNGRHLTKHRWYNEYSLPSILLEVGQQYAVPVGTGGGAACRATYAELKFGFKNKFSVGARLIDFAEAAYGTDLDGYPEEFRQQFIAPYSDFGRINTMRLVNSNTLFVDYYFPRKNGWVYIGAGGGWYHFDGLETLSIQGGPNAPVFVLPGIPSASRAGAVLRLGHKIGFFRTGFDLNLTGSDVPDYVSFHVGLEPGVFIFWE